MIDHFGEDTLLMVIGLVTGLIFGASAYHSRFCLRAATAEVAAGVAGPKLAIWLIAFLTALVAVQSSIQLGWLDVGNSRQIGSVGSLSGAVVGGVMFGVGMILARGCASRLLVLSASGNLRAIITGLVLTLTAQAALRGVLSPAREALFSAVTIPGGDARDLSAIFAVPREGIVVAALLSWILAISFGLRKNLRASELLAAIVVGLAVWLGWWLTYVLAQNSFELVAVQSVTFTGPSTDTLMALINTPEVLRNFGTGLVPGVFVGAMCVALAKGEARIQRFESDTPMERYLLGGMLMGFGAMLAGGCAVGAGVTGGAALSLTAWVAIFAMWVGAVGSQWLIRVMA
ncbi:YeeE/YedE family protein [uncultured Shimia sp.]|uniref:YeeE/YedE family protein n=1 Tax=uncultured Shimia sp. TaxID=573152 RepID=UPI0026036960|nr:YeeE/YedE family protein [uncultured Shimia sp.]